MSVLHPKSLVTRAAGSLPVHIVRKDGPLDSLGDAATAAWAGAHDFTGKTGQLLVLPGGDGKLAGALLLGPGTASTRARPGGWRRACRPGCGGWRA